MGYAARGHSQPSHAFGTGASIGVHALLLSLFLFRAASPPQPADILTAPVTRLKFTLVGDGVPGRLAGSGSGASADRTRPPEVSPPRSRELTPSDIVQPVEFRIPVPVVDAPSLLPGSAIEIDPAAAGRGIGPGTGSGPGAGSGPPYGPGAGAGRDGIGEGFEVGTDVTAPQLVHEVRPAYTVEAMRAKVQGRVELDLVVLADGTVDQRRIRIVRSLDTTFGLDAQAIEAVKQWRFRPGRRHDQPVPVRVRVELTFTLR